MEQGPEEIIQEGYEVGFDFTGSSISSSYDRLFGEQLFTPYAKDLLSHLRTPKLHGIVLEVGCGTGRCTKEMVATCSPGTVITATDVSEDMIQYAANRVQSDLCNGIVVEYECANECSLPYADNTFDIVICQFGYMFADGECMIMMFLISLFTHYI